MEGIKTDKTVLKKFGLIMASCFILVSLIMSLKHNNTAPLAAVTSLCLILVMFIAPGSLKYIYIIWMKLAFILSWINTRLLLCIIFYLILYPIGLFMRLFNIDLLERRFIPANASYWKPKETREFSASDYQKRF
ncbi:MAG: SxtJ family membrane protein [Candidatus Omnitrophica bacterium]|nr:SxtJ family membrane protein [Candidatus Omnitrophota bacterium]